MKIWGTAVRGASGLAVLLAVALSFVESFVRVSFDTEFELEFDSSFGTSAWHSFATIGCLAAIMSLIAVVGAVVVGLVGPRFIARILDAVAAGLALVAIALLLAWVASNGPEFDESLEIDYGLGWSGYATVSLLALGGALSVLSALLPAPEEESTVAPVPVAEPGAPATLPENQKALWSMILGIVSFACGAPITSIIAIVLANQATREIDATGGQQAGESKARAGLILGIVSTVLSVLGIVLVIVLLLVGANAE